MSRSAPLPATTVLRGRAEAGASAIRIAAAGGTDQGRKRRRNEDAFVVRPDLGLFAVADGLGGHVHGDVASNGTIDLITAFFDDQPEALRITDTVGDAFVAAVTRANEWVHLGREHQPEGQGMGSTFAGILVAGDRVYVAHVGDSRVYRHRDGRLEALTRDHNEQNEMLQQGFPPDFVRAWPDRYVLARALGTRPSVDVTLRIESARPGDVWLISTDGLHGVVHERHIGTLLRARVSPNTVVDRLIARANRAGGPDNVTAIVVAVRASVRRRPRGTRSR